MESSRAAAGAHRMAKSIVPADAIDASRARCRITAGQFRNVIAARAMGARCPRNAVGRSPRRLRRFYCPCCPYRFAPTASQSRPNKALRANCAAEEASMYQRKESSGGSYIGSGDSHNGVRVAIKLAASKTLATSKKGEKSAPQRAFGRRRCNPRCVNLILTIAAAAHHQQSQRKTPPY